jgi:enoyl-CoA hydratase
MAYENALLEIADGIATLTVSRPKVLNALSRGAVADLTAALASVASDRSIRALILTGAGEKAFVAGADVGEMLGMSPSDALAFAEAGHRLGTAIEALVVPTIAAVNGFALGGGCELAMTCDLIYASANARFGQPEVNLGVIPGFGGTARLVRRIGLPRAREWLFTGEVVDAARANALGLVLEVLPQDKLLPHCREVAKKIAGKGSLAIAQLKRVIRTGADLPLDAANALERQAFAGLFGSHDQKEGMAALLEKRPPRFTGE